LGLLNLPTSVQNLVLEGKLTMGHARELSKFDDSEKIKEYAKKIIDENLGYVHMNGNEVFKIAVNTLTNDVINILEKNQITPDKIDLFIPHQANLRIIEAVKNRLEFSDEQCIVTVGKFGNTSSASIPMAINDAYESGRLKNGSLMLLDAFGGGFTWGSALLKFGGK
ncbi:MAG: hypothetical protein IKH66_03650, partial [Campylobacter sp.]|nr:hypothetical protein [Campylobacter sp.]